MLPRTFNGLVGSALLSSVLLVASGTAHGATCRWVGPQGGAWNNAANWSGHSVPRAHDSVVIGAQETVAIASSAHVTVANLSVGAGAEVKNAGHIKVTAATHSRGAFTGKGTLDIPKGATAVYEVRPSTRKGFSLAALGAESVAETVEFPPINNKGTLVTKVAAGCSADFASILNDGIAEVVAEGVVNFDALTNHKGGSVKLSGSRGKRFYHGKSISNEGNLEISGAQIELDGNVSNAAGATLVLDSDASLAPAEGTDSRLLNAGKIVKPAGSDATIEVDWSNSGQVVIQEGTLHVVVSEDEKFKQTDGKTTLDGVLAVEVATDEDSDATGTFEIAGGSMDGIGTIDGNLINSGGHIKPGHSPGSITINGNFTQTAGGVLDMEVGGTADGSYDQLLVNGTAYLDGTLNWIRWNNFVPSNGDVYTIFTYYSKVGNFAQFTDATPVAGISYNTTLTPTDLELNCFTTPDGGVPYTVVTSPTSNKAAASVTSATGTAGSDGDSPIVKVTGRLYRYDNSVTGVPAGYWAGGSTWTSSYSATNERTASGTTSWSLAFPTLGAGKYSFRATAVNAMGNDETGAGVAFYVDPNAPTTLTVAAPAPGGSISSLSKISGAASDAADGSGIATVQLRLKRNADNLYWNGGAWNSAITNLTSTYSATTATGGNWTRTAALPAGTTYLKAGAYTITVIATDRAGNAKTITSTFTVSASAPAG